MWALLAIISVGIVGMCMCHITRRRQLAVRSRYTTRSIGRKNALRYLKLNMYPIEPDEQTKKTQKAYVNDIVTKRHKQSFVRMDTDQ